MQNVNNIENKKGSIVK